MFAATLEVAIAELDVVLGTDEVVLTAALAVAMALDVVLAAALEVVLAAALVEVLATELLLLARP